MKEKGNPSACVIGRVKMRNGIDLMVRGEICKFSGYN